MTDQLTTSAFSSLLLSLQSLTPDQLKQWMFLRKQTANSYFRSKEYQTAISAYKTALLPLTHSLLTLEGEEKQEVEGCILLNIATCLYCVGEYGEALEYTERVVKERGRHAETYEKKGMILRRMGREEEGRKVLREAVGCAKGRVKERIRGVLEEMEGKKGEVETGVETNVEIGGEETTALIGGEGGKGEEGILVYKERNYGKRLCEWIKQVVRKVRLGEKWKGFKGYFTLFEDDD